MAHPVVGTPQPSDSTLEENVTPRPYISDYQLLELNVEEWQASAQEELSSESSDPFINNVLAHFGMEQQQHLCPKCIPDGETEEEQTKNQMTRQLLCEIYRRTKAHQFNADNCLTESETNQIFISNVAWTDELEKGEHVTDEQEFLDDQHMAKGFECVMKGDEMFIM